MATTAKTLDVPATGSNQNVWGANVLNPNFVKIDSAFGGTQAVALTNSNVTLSSSEALNVFIDCSGVLSADVDLIFPARGSFYVIRNGCTGAHTVTAITAAAGDSVIIPQGASAFVWTDGTDMMLADGLAASGQLIYAVDTGVADAYVVSPPLAVPLKAGATVFWTPLNANTGACTIAVSGAAATAIKTIASADPVAGAIVPSAVYASTYNGTAWITQGLGAANFGLYSADAGASAGPTLDLYRNSASPAASDEIGEIIFYGNNSTPTRTAMARAFAKIIDPTAASEDIQIQWQTLVAGTSNVRMYLGAGLTIGSATGGDKGAGAINAEELYHNGIPVGALVTLTAAASVSLDYTSLVPGIYDIYFNNIVIATNGNPFSVRFSVGGVFMSTNYHYQVNAGIGLSFQGGGTDTTANGTSILLIATASNSVVGNITGSATLIVGGATAGGTSIDGGVNLVTSGGSYTKLNFSGRNTTASQIDGIRFLDPTPGNITSGSVTIFRRA